MEHENTGKSAKSVEAFLRPLIGLAVGAVPAIATKNVLLTLGLFGVCSVLSDVTLPYLLDRLPGQQLKQLLVLLMGVTLLAGGGFEWYMRHDGSGYARGQVLTVTYPDRAIQVKLLTDWQKSEPSRSLTVGEQVLYLGQASPRKEIRLPERPDGIHFLNAFYRKVQTRRGQIGWVYGSFLR